MLKHPQKEMVSGSLIAAILNGDGRVHKLHLVRQLRKFPEHLSLPVLSVAAFAGADPFMHGDAQLIRKFLRSRVPLVQDLDDVAAPTSNGGQSQKPIANWRFLSSPAAYACRLVPLTWQRPQNTMSGEQVVWQGCPFRAPETSKFQHVDK